MDSQKCRILIAPDSFKESLSAVKVAFFLKKGLENSGKDFEYDLAPVSDGGEGFMKAMVSGTNGYFKAFTVNDALMRPVEAEIGFSRDGKTAFIEMASASGIERLILKQRNPLVTSTYGTGELIRHAIESGCLKIILGIGGSATNDGGAGMAQALGIGLLDAENNPIGPGGGNLNQLASIHTDGLLFRLPEIIVACDVSNPLTGPKGASAVYGPQKGATPAIVDILDRNLKHFAVIIKNQLGIEIDNIPGAGAAGGLGAGLMAFTGASLKNGFQILAETIQLEKRISQADIIITGEGCMDSQTLHGKAPFGVAQLARKYKKPVFGVAGTLGNGYQELYMHGFDILISILHKPATLYDSIENASEYTM